MKDQDINQLASLLRENELLKTQLKELKHQKQQDIELQEALKQMSQAFHFLSADEKKKWYEFNDLNEEAPALKRKYEDYDEGTNLKSTRSFVLGNIREDYQEDWLDGKGSDDYYTDI
jgi:hypothetical protein